MMQHAELALDCVVAQREGNIVSDMGGEKVMLSVQNGRYYNLGEMGGQIWELIGVKRSIRELVASLMSIYEVEESVCEQQVLEFLGQLGEEGLIAIGESPEQAG